MNKEDYIKLSKVANKAIKQGLGYDDQISICMDLECAYNDVGLNLDKLLKFDFFSFAHDIYGIADNLNRATKKIENCFLPRCAR